MKKVAKILRGISGAGKSTYIKKMFPDAFVCSANDYSRSIKDSEVVYNVFKNAGKEPHHYVDISCISAIHNNQLLIAIDDKNIKLWEFESIVYMLEKWGYEIEVIRLDVGPEIANQRINNGYTRPEANKIAYQILCEETFPGETIISSEELDKIFASN